MDFGENWAKISIDNLFLPLTIEEEGNDVTVHSCGGLMDDLSNVHGCCVAVNEVVDSRTLRCSYRHEQAKGFQYWAKAEDEISFIDRKNMASLRTTRTIILKAPAPPSSLPETAITGLSRESARTLQYAEILLQTNATPPATNSVRV